jgi:hypothetical protein
MQQGGFGAESTKSVVDQKNRRRSERIDLRVPVIVSVKLASGKLVHYEPHTSSVNAHGGLLDLGIEIPLGQRFVLSNPKTQRAEPCRVVRVDHIENARFGIAFEFETPSPEFWSLEAPPTDWKPFRR